METLILEQAKMEIGLFATNINFTREVGEIED